MCDQNSKAGMRRSRTRTSATRKSVFVPARAERLESRTLLSSFVWTNRGSASNDSDGFNSVFGSRSAQARAVVDAALASWGTVISFFNRSNGDNSYSLAISMSPSGTSGGASTSNVAVDANNIPLSASISIGRGADTNGDGKGDGGNWYLNANPYDFSPILGKGAYTLFNAFGGQNTTATAPIASSFDLYSIVTHEIGHAVGFYAANPRFKALSTNTNVVDTISSFQAGTSPAIGDLWTFNGPDVRGLLTSFNSGGNTGGPSTDSNGPEHYAYEFNSYSNGGPTYYGTRNLMNAVGSVGEHFLISDPMALMLKDAYNYNIVLPSTLPTYYDNVLPDGTLRIQLPASNNAEQVSVSLSAGRYQVYIAGGSPVNGIDPVSINTTYFLASTVSKISITTGEGNDTIVLDNLGSVPVSVFANGGNDSLVLNNVSGALAITPDAISGPTINLANLGGIESLTINGSASNDTFNYTGINGVSSLVINGLGGNDTLNVGSGDLNNFYLHNFTFDGGSGSNTINYNNATSGDDWTYGIRQNNYVNFTNSTAFAPANRTDFLPNVQTIGITGGAGSDNFIVYQAAAGAVLNLYGGAGNDSLRVGSSLDSAPAATIPATENFFGQGGYNSVQLDDAGASSGHTYSITASSIRTSAAGTLNFDSTTQRADVTGPAFASVFSATGGTDNTFFYLTGGAGNDLFTFTGSAYYNATITGSGGTNTLSIDDRAASFTPFHYDLSANSLVRTTGFAALPSVYTLAYSSIASLVVYYPNNATTTTITGVPPTPGSQFTLLGGTAADAFTLIPRDPTGNLTINGTLGVSGGAGADTFTIDDSASAVPLTYDFSNPFGPSTQDISGLGTGLLGIGNDVETITVNAGAADDTFNLNSYASTSALHLNGNGGNDTLNLTPVGHDVTATLSGAATMYFDGGAGIDAFNVDNQACSRHINYLTQGSTENISVFTLQYSYSFGIGIPNVEDISQYGGTDIDNFIVRSLPAGGAMFIDGGASADTVVVTSAISNGTTQLIAGTLTVAGDGTDTIQFDDRGDTTGRSFHVDGTSVGSAAGDNLFAPGGSFILSGTAASVTVFAGSGADTVFATPSSSTAIVLDGGAPNTAPGDILNLNVDDTLNPLYTSVSATTTRLTSDNHLPVTYSNFENDPSLDTTPPTALYARFDLAAIALRFFFSEPLGGTISPASLTLVDTSTGIPVTLDSANFASSTDFFAKSLAFTFPGFDAGLLPAGLYTATLTASAVTDRSGNPLPADFTYTFLYAPAAASLAVAPGQSTLSVQQVAINPTARVDLADNSLVVDYTGASPLSDLLPLLASGYADGAWTGPGLFSSTAITDPDHLHAIAYAEASDLFALSDPASTYPWQGRNVDSTSVLLKYTYVGDTDLSGTLDGLDYRHVLEGVTLAQSGWKWGDNNYDGVADNTDMQRFAPIYQHVTSPPQAPATPSGIAGSPPPPSVVQPTVVTALPHVQILSQSDTAVAGKLLDAIRTQLLDASGNPVTDPLARLNIRILSGPDGATLSGKSSVRLRSGFATFDRLTLRKAGKYVLEISTSSGAIAYSPAQLLPITILPDTPSRLLINPSTSAPRTGTPFGVVVTAYDRYGNLITSGAVSLVSSSPTLRRDNAIPTTFTTNLIDGVATFSDLILTHPGTLFLTASLDHLRTRTARLRVTP